MNLYTFGQLLNVIELGQIAEAVDGHRRMRLLDEGLVWLNGPYQGKLVQVQSYLLSDLWTLSKDDHVLPLITEEEQAKWKRKQLDMLENQLFEQRAQRFDSSEIPDIKE